MNWSNMALKGTIGAGSLGTVAILADPLDPYIGVWGMIALVIVPLTILVFFKNDELPAYVVKAAHGFAAGWYIALLVATVGLMAMRGFEPTDVLLGFFMALGLWPCGVIFEALLRGAYDGEQV